jgi:hypothetical protein
MQPHCHLITTILAEAAVMGRVSSTRTVQPMPVMQKISTVQLIAISLSGLYARPTSDPTRILSNEKKKEAISNYMLTL